MKINYKTCSEKELWEYVAVPFVLDVDKVFLKTIIPNRKFKKLIQGS